jgi:hypothetical protein
MSVIIAEPYLPTRLAGSSVSSEISRGVRKLARTPQIIKKKKKNHDRKKKKKKEP